MTVRNVRTARTGRTAYTFRASARNQGRTRIDRIIAVDCDFLEKNGRCSLLGGPCVDPELEDSHCIHSNSWEMPEEDDARFDVEDINLNFDPQST